MFERMLVKTCRAAEDLDVPDKEEANGYAPCAPFRVEGLGLRAFWV